MGVALRHAEPQELGGQVGQDQLKDMFRVRKIVESIDASIMEDHILGQRVRDQLLRRLRSCLITIRLAYY